MKGYFRTPSECFPPCVIGSVSDWDTWLSITSPTSIPACNALELRVDALSPKFQLNDLLSRQPNKPLLVTIRHKSEGGLREIEEPQRMELMHGMLSLASAIDWEVDQLAHAKPLLEAARNMGVRIITSHHNFECTPSLQQLQAKEEYARSMGADMVKFAFRLNNENDILVGAQLLRQAKGPMAVMGMGSLGPVSRLLYSQLGSALIYGYLGDTPTAPGQWSTKLCMEALNSLNPL